MTIRYCEPGIKFKIPENGMMEMISSISSLDIVSIKFKIPENGMMEGGNLAPQRLVVYQRDG